MKEKTKTPAAKTKATAAKVKTPTAKATPAAKAPAAETKTTVKTAAKRITKRSEKAAEKTAEKRTTRTVKKVEKPDFDSIIADIRTRAAGFDASSYQGFLAIQVTLTDMDNRPFYVEVKDGRLSIEPYEYYDRQANIIMNSDNFVKMINGKLNKTLAFTTGKLKIDGDIGKASELGNLLKG